MDVSHHLKFDVQIFCGPFFHRRLPLMLLPVRAA